MPSEHKNTGGFALEIRVYFICNDLNYHRQKMYPHVDCEIYIKIGKFILEKCTCLPSLPERECGLKTCLF